MDNELFQPTTGKGFRNISANTPAIAGSNAGLTPEESNTNVQETSANLPVIETPAFKAWFGNSVVKDEQGNPLRVFKGISASLSTAVYNGLGKLLSGDPNEHTPIEVIQRTEPFPSFYNKEEPPVHLAGFFTDDPEVASHFAENYSRGSVYPCYLRIEKPFIMDLDGGHAGNAQFGASGQGFRDAIRSGKYDGVILYNTKDEGNVYVIINSNQAKSAIGNNGQFSREDNRITAAISPEDRTLYYGTSTKPFSSLKPTGGDKFLWLGEYDVAHNMYAVKHQNSNFRVYEVKLKPDVRLANLTDANDPFREIFIEALTRKYGDTPSPKDLEYVSDYQMVHNEQDLLQKLLKMHGYAGAIVDDTSRDHVVHKTINHHSVALWDMNAIEFEQVMKAAAKQDSETLKAFMQDLWSQTSANPFNNRERVWKNVAGIECYPFDGRIHLSFIRSFEKNTGQGRDALKFVCDLADKHQVEIDLAPVPVGNDGLSLAKLRAWYMRNGFTPKEGRTSMVRIPKGEPKVLKLKGFNQIAATTGEISLWHGGRISGPIEIQDARKGRYEAGPGLYLTTSYARASKYAKGGGSTFLITLKSGLNFADDVLIPLNEGMEFAKKRLGAKGKLIAEDLKNNCSRSNREAFYASVLINLVVNYESGAGAKGRALLDFLREHNVDIALENQSGNEQWVVVFNPEAVVRVRKVPASEVTSDMYNMPKVATIINPRTLGIIAEKARHELIGNRPAISGDCEPVSDMVYDALKNKGYDPSIVYGGYFVEEEIEEPHTWISVSGYYIDPTHDQFENWERWDNEDCPAIRIGKETDENYRADYVPNGSRRYASSTTAGKKEWLGLALAPLLMTPAGAAREHAPTKPVNFSQTIDNLPADYKSDDFIDRRHGEQPTLSEKARDVGIAVRDEFNTDENNKTPEELQKELNYKSSSITSDFPTFEEFSAAYDVLNLSENYDYYAEDAEDMVDGFNEMTPEEKERAVIDLVSAKVESVYDNIVSFYEGMTFPAILYRVVNLPNIEALRMDNIGESWTWDEGSAEAFLPGTQGRFMLKASVPYESIDWHETLMLNMDTSLGEVENEVRLKFDAPLELLAYRSKQHKEWTPVGKSVTASDVYIKSAAIEHPDTSWVAEGLKQVLKDVQKFFVKEERRVQKLKKDKTLRLYDSVLERAFRNAFNGRLMLEGSRSPVRDTQDIISWFAGAGVSWSPNDYGKTKTIYINIREGMLAALYTLFKKQGVDHVWREFTYKVEAYVAHEMVHDAQDASLVKKEQERGNDPYYRTNKLFNQLKTIPRHGWAEYLASRIEIEAWAASAVKELRQSGLTDTEISQKLGKEPEWVDLDKRSSSFNTYLVLMYQAGKQKEPRYKEAFKVFLKKMYQHLTSNKTASVAYGANWMKPGSMNTLNLDKLARSDNSNEWYSIQTFAEELDLDMDNANTEVPVTWVPVSECGFDREETGDEETQEAYIAKLAEAMKAGHLISPVIFRDGELIDGHHRCAAANLLGLKSMPSIDMEDVFDNDSEEEDSGDSWQEFDAVWDCDTLCAYCKGIGYDPKDTRRQCPTCEGTGCTRRVPKTADARNFDFYQRQQWDDEEEEWEERQEDFKDREFTDLELINKYVDNAPQSLSEKELVRLGNLVKNSKCSASRIIRVDSREVIAKVGQVVDFKMPLSFTKNWQGVLKGRAASSAAWTSGKRALLMINKPTRGLEVDYSKLQLSHPAEREQEVLIAGQYKVVKVTRVVEPGRGTPYMDWVGGEWKYNREGFGWVPLIVLEEVGGGKTAARNSDIRISFVESPLEEPDFKSFRDSITHLFLAYVPGAQNQLPPSNPMFQLECNKPIPIPEGCVASDLVGWAYFATEGDTHHASNVYVEPAFRRQGVATALYNAYEMLTGNKLVPDKLQSDSGAAFSKSRLASKDMWYHGSKNKFDAFQAFSKAGVTPEVAEQPIFLTPDRHFAELHAGAHGYVYTVQANVTNTFRGTELLNWNERYYLDPRTYPDLGKKVYSDIEEGRIWPDGGDDPEGYMQALANMQWDTTQCPEFVRWLKANGYDSFIEIGEGSENMGVFDPTKLKIVDVTSMSKRG